MVSLRTLRHFILPAFLMGLVAWMAACGSNEVPSLEERAQSIDQSLMCPVCPGETIDQSQVELASQMRAIVREKLQEGWTRDQVLQFFVERYGEGVLAAPPKEGFNLLVWVVPPGVLLGGAMLLLLIIRSMRRSDEGGTGSLEEGEMEPYLAKAEAEMKGMESTQRPMHQRSTPESKES